MRLLLDTYIALWSASQTRTLRPAERRAIEEADVVAVSVVSVWEIAIKHALNRGQAGAMPIGGEAALSVFREAGYRMLDVTAEHVLAVERLQPIHGDPFDRMLVAQARTGGMTLLTRDARLLGDGGFVAVV